MSGPGPGDPTFALLGPLVEVSAAQADAQNVFPRVFANSWSTNVDPRLTALATMTPAALRQLMQQTPQFFYPWNLPDVVPVSFWTSAGVQPPSPPY